MSAPARPLDAEALLVHGPFLRALARSLLSDDALADDVVQQTYATALEKPPRQAGSLRAWMATVARNLARERGRREGRRRGWEQGAARSEALPSTDEIVEREAVRQQVVEAVLDLDPLYRDVILLRYYEDLAPRHIARELGLPVETVRTRLKRGLARLEASLDRRHGGDRTRWMAALAPMAFTRSAQAGILGWVTESLATLGPGVQLAAVGALVIALATSGYWWDEVRQALPSGEAAASADPGSGDSGDSGADLAGLGAGDPGDVEGLPDDDRGALLAPPAPPCIAGRLLAADGSPLAGAEVLAAGIAFDDVQTLLTAGRETLDALWSEHRVLTDNAGRFAAGSLSRGVWVLAAPGGGERPVTLGGVVLVDIPLPLAMAADQQLRTRCAEAGLEPPTLHRLAVDGTLTLDLRTGVSDARPRDVVVTDPDGHPLAGAELQIGSSMVQLALGAAPYRGWTWGRLAPLVPSRSADAEGALRAVPLEVGGLIVARAPGHATRVVSLDEDRLRDPTLRVTLEPTLSLDVSGRVVDAGGRAVPGALVTLDEYAISGAPEALRTRVVRDSLLHVAESDAEGRFRFEGVRELCDDPWDPVPVAHGERLSVNAGHAGQLNAHAWVDVGPQLVASTASGLIGQHAPADVGPDSVQVEVELELTAGGPFELTLIDRDSLMPVEGVAAGAKVANDLGGTTESVLETDEDGFTVFENTPHGRVELSLHRVGFESRTHVIEDWRGDPVELLIAWEPVGWMVDVVLSDGTGRQLMEPWTSPDDDLPRVPFRLTAWAHDPRPAFARGGHRLDVPGLTIPVQGHAVSARWTRHGPVLPLRDDFPGDQAWVSVSRFGELLTVERVVRGQDRLELVVPRLAATADLGELVVDVQAGDASLFVADVAVLDPDTGAIVARLDNSWSVAGRRAMLPAGRYDLAIDCWGDYRHVVEDVEVLPGAARSDLVVELPAPARLKISCVDELGRGLPARAVLHDADGDLLYSSLAPEERVDLRLVVPGVHHLSLWSGERRLTSHVALEPGDERELVLTLAPAGQLTVVNTRGDGRITLEDGAGRLVHAGLLAADESLRLPVDPGSYTLLAMTPGAETLRLTVEVGADGQTVTLR